MKTSNFHEILILLLSQIGHTVSLDERGEDCAHW